VVILCSKPNGYKRRLYYLLLTSALAQGTKIKASLQEKVAAQAVQGQPTSPADSSDDLTSATQQAIVDIPMAGTPAPRSIPHDDHPAPARPLSMPQNVAMV